jgi:hypothetical protein
MVGRVIYSGTPIPFDAKMTASTIQRLDNSSMHRCSVDLGDFTQPLPSSFLSLQAYPIHYTAHYHPAAPGKAGATSREIRVGLMTREVPKIKTGWLVFPANLQEDKGYRRRRGR